MAPLNLRFIPDQRQGSWLVSEIVDDLQTPDSTLREQMRRLQFPFAGH